MGAVRLPGKNSVQSAHRQLEAMAGLQGFPDGFQLRPIPSHRLGRADRRLLGRVSHKLPMVTNPEAEGNPPTEIPATLPLIGLDGGDTLSDPIPFGFGHGRQDGEHQFADAIAAHIATEVDHVQADLAVFELGEDVQSVQSRAKHSIKLGGDYGVTGLESVHQRLPLWPVADWLAAAYTSLNERLSHCQAVHEGIASNRALLD